ncbi:MAG: PAS domain-containing sensor histidine kinase [Gemmatimonadetes bacterium]|nr:PAS domain-containing sensor histidine kinase [Gemmatimonadota bacterium]
MRHRDDPSNPQTPDPVIPGPEAGPTLGPGRSEGRETREREEAWRRGEVRARERAENGPGDRRRHPTLESTRVAQQAAFIALAENVRDYAIFLMDPDGIITYWGEGARLIKWWTRDQIVGAQFRVLYMDGGSEDGTAEDHLVEAARRGEMVSEGQRVRSDGSTFWAGATLTALRDFDGTLLGYSKLTRDMTSEHATDDALRSARAASDAARKVEAENRAKGEFLSAMSHELRTPLQAIIAYADLLDMQIEGTLNDLQREQLGRIRVSSRHLLGLAQEVLDLSRLDSGHLAVKAGAHRLGSATEDSLTMIVPQAADKGVGLVNAVGGTAAELCYWGDEDRVRQILVNLLTNAVKFTPEDGRVTISAGSTQQAPPDTELGGPGPWMYIRVEDNGKGMPAEQLTTIFEPYEQLEGAPIEGAGLGLAISQRLARLMGGDLTVTSTDGIGSSFFLWLQNSATRPELPPE